MASTKASHRPRFDPDYEKIMAVIPPFLEVPTKDAIPKMRQLVEARQAPVLAKLTSDTSLHYQERTITGPRGEITLSILSPATTTTRAAGAQRTDLPCVLFLREPAHALRRSSTASCHFHC